MTARRFRIVALSAVLAVTAGAEEPKTPAQAIQDNSFLLEEAYNQEAGVVQHIFNLSLGVDRQPGADDREWQLSLTEEWPLGSQAHQFSYTIPYTWLKSRGASENGFGDILLNYRYQLLMETDRRPAIAPRLSVILPTGSRKRGTGVGAWGLETNVAFSKVLNDRWTAHLNTGLTSYPEARGESLTSYNLGASLIYAATPRLNFLVEAIASWDQELAEGRGTEREFSALVSPGFRYAFNFSGGTQVVVGAAAPIGLTRAAPDYGLFLYLSIEHGFLRQSPAASEFTRSLAK